MTAEAYDVGVVGGGQLARMLAQAAIALDIRLGVLAVGADESAAQVTPHVLLGSPDAPEALAALARRSRVVTFDHELVDAEQLAALEGRGVCLRPSAATAALAQDKERQRATFGAAGLPQPAHRPVRDRAELLAFADEHGWPIVAKARRGGYDGRGVWVLDGPAAARALADEAAAREVALLAEAWVPLEREVAVLVARRPGGAAVVYPPVETVQVEGICRAVLYPSPLPGPLAAEAERLARRVAEVAGASGNLAVELFVSGGRLLINEIAARPHNAGHWTIEGSRTSQFENHLRGVLDLPLGATDALAPAVAMVNVLGGPRTGDVRGRLAAALAVEGVRVHLYGKAARPGRKIGHVTALGADRDETRARATRAAALLAGDE